MHSSKRQAMWSSALLVLFCLGLASSAPQETLVIEPPGQCSNAQWTHTVFLKSARDTQSFSKISEWRGADYQDWVVHDMSKEWIPSSVFAGIAFGSFVVLSLWRLFSVCCCQRHRRNPQGQSLTETSTHTDVEQPKAPASHPYAARRKSLGPLNRTSLILSVVIGVLAITSFGLTIWGITSASKGLAQQGWQQVDKTNAYVERLANNVDALLANFSRINTVVDDLQTIADSLGLPELSALMSATGDDIKGGVSDLVHKYNGSAQEVRLMVVDRIDQMRANYYAPTIKYDNWRYSSLIVIFSLCLFVLVVLCVAMIINCPALFTLSTVIIALMVVLYFVMAMSMAFALAGGNDACPAVETIALSFVGKSPKVKTMAEYYFYNKGGNLTDVLAKAQVIDVRALDELVNALAELTHQVAEILVPVTRPGSQLRFSLINANDTMGDIITSRNQLLESASYPAFAAVYGESRAFVCCSVPDQFAHLWNACTAAGWILMVMTWVCCVMISQYSQMHGSEVRCGWVRVSSDSTPTQPQPLRVAAPVVGGSEGDSMPSDNTRSTPGHYTPPVVAHPDMQQTPVPVYGEQQTSLDGTTIVNIQMIEHQMTSVDKPQVQAPHPPMQQPPPPPPQIQPIHALKPPQVHPLLPQQPPPQVQTVPRMQSLQGPKQPPQMVPQVQPMQPLQPAPPMQPQSSRHWLQQPSVRLGPLARATLAQTSSS